MTIDLSLLRATAAASTVTVPLPQPDLPLTVWCKLELQLTSGSTKDRIAGHILARAVEDGRLRSGATVVEASSGSTSISLAMACAQLGLRFVAVMPEGVSPERLLIIRRLGGHSVLTPAADGVPGSIERTLAMAADDPTVFLTDQFHNPANAEAHELATGPELVAQVRRWLASTDVDDDGSITVSQAVEQGADLTKDALRNIASTAPRPVAQNDLVKSLTDLGYKATDATRDAVVEGLGNVEQLTGGSVLRTVGQRGRSAVYEMNATIAKQILKGLTGT